MRELLGQPGAPLFGLISRRRLTACSPTTPAAGTDGRPAEPVAPAAFLLDVNPWLEHSGVTIR